MKGIHLPDFLANFVLKTMKPGIVHDFRNAQITLPKGVLVRPPLSLGILFPPSSSKILLPTNNNPCQGTTMVHNILQLEKDLLSFTHLERYISPQEPNLMEPLSLWRQNILRLKPIAAQWSAYRNTGWGLCNSTPQRGTSTHNAQYICTCRLTLQYHRGFGTSTIGYVGARSTTNMP